MNPHRPAVLILTILSMLTACGGGSGTGDAMASAEFTAQSPDPVVVDLPIAYIKRALLLAPDGSTLDPLNPDNNPTVNASALPLRPEDLLSPADFRPGARLYLRDRAAPTATQFPLTDMLFEPGSAYDVKDLSVAPAGDKLVFALRSPERENANEDEQPRWDIWTYDLAGDTLERVITSEPVAQSADDVSPAFLPDGRIVFSSNRQLRSRSVLLDDGKPQYAYTVEGEDEPAFVLHVMDADGGNIKQISYNQSHDLQPTVLDDGRVLYLRWDNTAGNDAVSLYAINPDGSGLSPIYGRNSQLTGTQDTAAAFWRPVPMEDGTVLAILRPRSSDHAGGDLVSLDIQQFTDHDQPFASPAGITGTGQTSLTLDAVDTRSARSANGLFQAAWPLYDGTDRLLVSWSQCRLQAPDGALPVPCTPERLANDSFTPAPALYGLWLYDPTTQTQLPITTPVEGEMVSEVAVLAPRPAPLFLPDSKADNDAQQALVNDGAGLVNIRSVYDIAGVDTSAAGISVLADPALTPAAERPARFLRIIKPVPLPDDDTRDFDNAAFGISRAQQMREVLGTVTVEPDGSALFRVPADTAFGITVLDSQGKRLSARHNNWLHVKAGSTLTCNGCHTASSPSPHGHLEAEHDSINAGAATSGSPFPNTRTELQAEMGETMAETWARTQAPRTLTQGLAFTDDWSIAPGPGFVHSYADLQTPPPSRSGCLLEWSIRCRLVINYPDHIAPIWTLPRTAEDGSTTTCNSCHNNVDAAGNPRVAAAQLVLTNTPSDESDLQVTSYRELLTGDEELELDVTGQLVTRLIPVLDADGAPSLQTDIDGNLILDSNGEPIPLLQAVGVSASMSANGARRSSRFFNPFRPAGSHAGWLTPSELTLLTEWLDIGAQYYNNPFDAPLD